MQIEGYEFPDDLFYDLNHNWARVEGDIAIQGITDFAQALAGEIVYSEVPRVGRDVKQGDTFMSMESGKWVGRIFAPVSGKIVEANEEMEWDPTIINNAPFTDGWMVKIEMTDPSDTSRLYHPSDAAFQDWVREELSKLG